MFSSVCFRDVLQHCINVMMLMDVNATLYNLHDVASTSVRRHVLAGNVLNDRGRCQNLNCWTQSERMRQCQATQFYFFLPRSDKAVQ